jgi:hypothetical protein
VIHSITETNVNGAFDTAWHYLSVAGVEEPSRNGPVLVAPTPVITTYLRPTERVLFSPRRDANHVFHLMESIWMLAGLSDVEWLSQFSSNISTYAEPDGYIHGAYGARWRNWFNEGEYDQLPVIINTLRTNPQSRQAVLQMWDPTADLEGEWRDRPCNTAIYFDCRGGKLNMTVTCRSNDILWGCYGANAVHMSMLQEVIAHAVGVPVGVYRQFSNNWHAYTDNDKVKDFLKYPPVGGFDHYESGRTVAIPLISGKETWQHFLDDCERVVNGFRAVDTFFMDKVAVPLRDAYLARKAGESYDVRNVPECDWKLGFQQWCERREIK